MILIATPSKEMVNAGFAYDLTKLMRQSLDSHFAISLGTLLCNQRTELVRTALKNNFTHILFIDSDMRFPEDALKRLQERKTAIVGANCMQRGIDKTTTGIPSKGRTGLEEVEKIGFGVTLIETEVFLKIPEPWFATPYDGEKFVGEDIFFCRKAKEHGYKILTDHDLSLQIKHEGIMGYQHQ